VIDLGDLRFALRLWARHRTLIAVATLSLGLGVGATTTMYSVLSRVAHYELGFADEDRLVIVSNTDADSGPQPPTYEIVEALLQSGRSFAAIGLNQPDAIPVTLSGAGPTMRVTQSPVNEDGLSVVGVAPLLGRTYRREDFHDVVKQKEARAIVISYDAWQQHFNGDPGVIGKTLRIDGEIRPVIGVMPKGFTLSPWVDSVAFWAATDLRQIPVARWMTAIARLKPGVSPEAAAEETTAISRRVLQARGEKTDHVGASVVHVRDWMFSDAAHALTFLVGTVSFVLLIGCANVANLLLAVGAARQRELALRAATGAGRGRLVRQLLTENLLLSVVGGVSGVLIALVAVRLYPLITPDEFPALLRHVSIDLRVLGFALGLSALSSLVFGLVPALRASRVDLNEALKEGGRTGGGVRRRGRNMLLVAEVSLAMVLLVGAGLMLQGLMSEQRRLPGFDPDGLLTANILVAGPKYSNKTSHDTNIVTSAVEAFYDQVLEQVRAMPGVTRAGIISRLPMNMWSHYFSIVGRPAPDQAHRLSADFDEVDAQAFDTLGLHLLRGRGITEGDVASAPWVVVINKTFADHNFPGQNPLGQSIRVSIGWGGQPGTFDEPQPRLVVGVVADVTYPSYFGQNPAVMYVPFRQHLQEYGSEDEWLHTGKVLLVRTPLDPLTLVRPIEAAVARVDPDQTAHDIRTMAQQIASSPSVATGRFFTSLFVVFGTLAVVLAMVGVYGVVAWAVGERTTEMGIRMAVGARPIAIVRLLLVQSLWPILLGVALGELGGFALSRMVTRMFWTIAVPGPAVLGAIAAVMLVAAIAAAWSPLRRVLKIAPQHLLRAE
jgi:putative ABC transport system permease protein